MKKKTPQYAALAVGIVDPKIRAFVAMTEAAESAADWLCDGPVGSDQRERGQLLREALRHLRNPSQASQPNV